MPNDSKGSLVEYIHHQMGGHDPAAADRFKAATLCFANDSTTQQIQLLNRYWRRQLSTLNISTIDAREALLDGINEAEWIRLFNRYVLPIILEHGLPAA